MNVGDWVKSKRGGPPIGRVLETGNAVVMVKLPTSAVVWLMVDDLEVCEAPAPDVTDVDLSKLGVTRVPVLRGELALLRHLADCVTAWRERYHRSEDDLLADVVEAEQALRHRRMHCWQTGLLLRGGVPGPDAMGETLCGLVVLREDWFGSSEQMGVRGPLDALRSPREITCEACWALLPRLAESFHEGPK